MNNKKVIVFDLDDTLSESKTDVDEEMSDLLVSLINRKLGWRSGVGVISGCAYEQMINQLLFPLSHASNNFNESKLYLMPASGSQLYTYGENVGWEMQYKESLLLREKVLICEAFDTACSLAGVYPEWKTMHGEVAEDRDSQITFSFCGQKAPSEVKKPWDPDQSKRLLVAQKMKSVFKQWNEEYEVTVGGSTSIDVTKKGRDKAYGMQKFINYLNIDKSEVLFIADALFEGGNDYSVKQAGFESLLVKDPEETKAIIKQLLESNNASV